MKILLTTFLILFLSGESNAQFKLSSSAGYGLKVNSEFEYDIFQSSISVEPQFQVDKFSIALIGLTLNDSTANFFTGVKAGFGIYEKENKYLMLTGSALKGMHGETMLGGGVQYGIDNAYIAADFYNENKYKNFIANLSFGYYIFNP